MDCAARSFVIVQLTLLRQNNPLADATKQLGILESSEFASLPRFAETVAAHGLPPLRAERIDVLQINVGKLCNQTCRHCHVDAGPDRRESMSRQTAEAVIDALERSDVGTLDITGGAPEMNPNFCWLVERARALGHRVIVRSNLTILIAPGYRHVPEFLARHEVEIVASLPCYLEENCDRQRGDGVFRQSIAALRRLNRFGYGLPQSRLSLTLVYNPIGPSLPPPQAELESDYRRELRRRYNIEFTRLFTITNLPISRFLDDLLQTGEYDNYMRKLVDAFNPAAVERVMCRSMLSVDWQGNLYDCDFNQMLQIPLSTGDRQTIFNVNLAALQARRVRTRRHCFGCTAGSGSSCGGTLLS